MKGFCAGFLLFVCACSIPFGIGQTAHAETIEQQLEQQTNSQLDGLDLEPVEKLLSETDTEIVGVFDGNSFKNLVQNIVDGKTTFSITTFFSACKNALLKSFQKLFPFVAALLAIILLASIFAKVKPSLAEKEVGGVIYFATFALVALIVGHLIASVMASSVRAVSSMQKQMQVSFPILLTLMTASGGVSSVKFYQPMVALLSGGVSSIFVGVLLPLFSISIVLVFVSNLSDNVKVDKFKDLAGSVFKWVLGFMSTIFMGYLAVQGITAATTDGVSIRTAKYAIKNYVPVLGGYISDGFEVVLASSVLIKNGVGLACLFLLLSSVLAPLFAIVVLSLALKLVAAVTEPVADKKFVSFLGDVSKTLNMLVAVIVGVALMYFLTIALIIGTANNIV